MVSATDIGAQVSEHTQKDQVIIGGLTYKTAGILAMLAEATAMGSSAAATMSSSIRAGQSVFSASAFLAAVVALGVVSDVTEIAHLLFDATTDMNVKITNPGDIAHNVTTGDVNVTGATAAEIANAIEGKVLKVKSAPNTTVDIAIPEPEARALAEDIAEKIAEETLTVGGTVDVGNHPTSIEVSNHPTSIEVSNHPTSIEVSNHPVSDDTYPTADAIAQAFEDNKTYVNYKTSNGTLHIFDGGEFKVSPLNSYGSYPEVFNFETGQNLTATEINTTHRGREIVRDKVGGNWVLVRKRPTVDIGTMPTVDVREGGADGVVTITHYTGYAWATTAGLTHGGLIDQDAVDGPYDGGKLFINPTQTVGDRWVGRRAVNLGAPAYNLQVLP